jgi:hypothetical protein
MERKRKRPCEGATLLSDDEARTAGKAVQRLDQMQVQIRAAASAAQ